MMHSSNIKRIARRHFRFEGIEFNPLLMKIIVSIVQECIKTQELSKSERDEKFRKLRRTMF